MWRNRERPEATRKSATASESERISIRPDKRIVAEHIAEASKIGRLILPSNKPTSHPHTKPTHMLPINAVTARISPSLMFQIVNLASSSNYIY